MTRAKKSQDCNDDDGGGRGRWTEQEHNQFEEGLRKHGKAWKRIALEIPTRTVVQIRTHAQKYFLKLSKVDSATSTSIALKPPSTSSHTSLSGAVTRKKRNSSYSSHSSSSNSYRRRHSMMDSDGEDEEEEEDGEGEEDEDYWSNDNGRTTTSLGRVSRPPKSEQREDAVTLMAAVPRRSSSSNINHHPHHFQQTYRSSNNNNNNNNNNSNNSNTTSNWGYQNPLGATSLPSNIPSFSRTVSAAMRPGPPLMVKIPSTTMSDSGMPSLLPSSSGCYSTLPHLMDPMLTTSSAAQCTSSMVQSGKSPTSVMELYPDFPMPLGDDPFAKFEVFTTNTNSEPAHVGWSSSSSSSSSSVSSSSHHGGFGGVVADALPKLAGLDRGHSDWAETLQQALGGLDVENSDCPYDSCTQPAAPAFGVVASMESLACESHQSAATVSYLPSEDVRSDDGRATATSSTSSWSSEETDDIKIPPTKRARVAPATSVANEAAYQMQGVCYQPQYHHLQQRPPPQQEQQQQQHHQFHHYYQQHQQQSTQQSQPVQNHQQQTEEDEDYGYFTNEDGLVDPHELESALGMLSAHDLDAYGVSVI